MARTGRPRKEINKEVFESLCRAQCTEVEICSEFDCSEDTLNTWCKRNYKNEHGRGMTFSEVFKQKRTAGLISLRRKQLKLAERSAAMAIFLGKNYLGQRDDLSVGISAGPGVQIYLPDNGRKDGEPEE